MTKETSQNLEQQRLDQWLWHARFFKSRTLAATIIKTKKVRIDGIAVGKPSFNVKPGQTLTFQKDKRVRVIEIVSLASRRGPAPEAQALYNDLSPLEPSKDEKKASITTAPTAKRDPGTGRPSKKERRALDHLRDY